MIKRRSIGAHRRFALCFFVFIGASCQSNDPGNREMEAIVPPAGINPNLTELLSRTRRTPTTMPAPQIVEDGYKSTLIYTAQYAQPAALREAVEGLISPEGTVQDSAALNVVVVSDRSEMIRPMLGVLKELDRPVAQLLVEARVMEVTLDSDLEYEIRHALTVTGGGFVKSSSISLSTPGASPQEDQGSLINLRLWESDGKTLDDFVRLLVSRGKAKLLSSPNLIVAAGTNASIITGEEVPVSNSTVVGGSIQASTIFKRVGIKLRVGLLQITNDTARVDINQEVSAVTGYTASTQNNPAQPVIAIRNVTSTVSVKDGEILSVGGLLRAEDHELTRGIPILQDIPGIGVLFKSERNQTSKTQLVFFLRTSILDEGHVGVARVHQPGDGLTILDTTQPATQPIELEKAR